MSSSLEPAEHTENDVTRLRLRLESLLHADSEGEAGWMGELAQAADRLALPVPQLRSLATYLTWIARRLGQPYPASVDVCSLSSTAELVRLYVCGQRFRFDFNFPGLSRFLDQNHASPGAGDALVQSFRVFASLGQRQAGAVALLNQTLQLDDVDTRARQVCLAGIWAACTLPEQPALLLDLANTMIEQGESDGTVYFRRAMAHRLLGKITEALDDIDYALSILPPGNNEINQDYLRERQLIALAAQFESAGRLDRKTS